MKHLKQKRKRRSNRRKSKFIPMLPRRIRLGESLLSLMQRKGKVHLYYHWWPNGKEQYEVAIPRFSKEGKRQGPKKQFYWYPSARYLGKRLWVFATEQEARDHANKLVKEAYDA